MEAITEQKKRIVVNAAPIRLTLDQITSKWAVLVLSCLCDEPSRFNTLRRRVDGITQKALTDTLRKLESSGLVARHVIAASPVAVEYSLTPLGWTLQEPFTSLCDWALCHQADVESARKNFALLESAKRVRT